MHRRVRMCHKRVLWLAKLAEWQPNLLKSRPKHPANWRSQSLVTPRSLALLTPAVVLVHGYHPLADDGAVYVAGIKKLADPSLYQADAVFASSPTHLSIFAHVLAALVRWGHPASPAAGLPPGFDLSVSSRLMESGSTNFRTPPRLLGSGVARCLLLHPAGRGHVALHHGSLCHGALLFHAAQSFRAGRRARREMGAVPSVACFRRAAASLDGWLRGDHGARRSRLPSAESGGPSVFSPRWDGCCVRPSS